MVNSFSYYLIFIIWNQVFCQESTIKYDFVIKSREANQTALQKQDNENTGWILTSSLDDNLNTIFLSKGMFNKLVAVKDKLFFDYLDLLTGNAFVLQGQYPRFAYQIISDVLKRRRLRHYVQIDPRGIIRSTYIVRGNKAVAKRDFRRIMKAANKILPQNKILVGPYLIQSINTSSTEEQIIFKLANSNHNVRIIRELCYVVPRRTKPRLLQKQRQQSKRKMIINKKTYLQQKMKRRQKWIWKRQNRKNILEEKQKARKKNKQNQEKRRARIKQRRLKQLKRKLAKRKLRKERKQEQRKDRKYKQQLRRKQRKEHQQKSTWKEKLKTDNQKKVNTSNEYIPLSRRIKRSIHIGNIFQENDDTLPLPNLLRASPVAGVVAKSIEYFYDQPLQSQDLIYSGQR